SLKDVTKNVVLINNQTNQSGDNHYPILDGMNVKVQGPPPGMKTWSIPSGARRLSPTGGAHFGLEGFSSTDPTAPQDQSLGTIGMAPNLAFGGIGTTLKNPTDFHDVLLKWAKVDSVNKLWDPNAVPTDTNYSLSYRYLRAATQDPTTFVPPRPEFIPWIKVAASGYPYQDYVYGVPFSAWDMSYNPPRRLAVGHFENNQPNGLVDGRYFPALTTVDNGDAAGPREMCFIYSSPYTTTPVAPFNTNISNNATMPIMWVMTCARRNDPPYPGNDQFLITANKVNTSDHTFSWTTTKPTIADAAAAKMDVTKVNVFPNPYLGFNPQEINKYARFVTFNHLPASATIRIFSLSGTLVRTLIKNDASTQFFQWDLNNEKGFPVAAGMYIAYIDMHDLGTKTLKLGIIPEQQYLDRW
ncbi:MAG TPA: T9SS type A sorting domain-containing protein, partial [Bacteroidota bacterium]|nr:T9SS type A sorting domain-containing protein [Bacteroidota bacterium]